MERRAAAPPSPVVISIVIANRSPRRIRGSTTTAITTTMWVSRAVIAPRNLNRNRQSDSKTNSTFDYDCDYDDDGTSTIPRPRDRSRAAKRLRTSPCRASGSPSATRCGSAPLDFRLQPFIPRAQRPPEDKTLKGEIRWANRAPGLQASAFYPAAEAHSSYESRSSAANRNTGRSSRREHFPALQP